MYLDICKEKVRRQFDSIPIQEVEYNLCDKTDIEEQILASDTIFLALEYIRYQPRFYAMSLLSTKFLGIKNADLSKTIVQIGFMPTSNQILDSVTQHFHLPWDFFENSFKNDYIPEYHDCQELSVYISKASNACAVSVRKKMQDGTFKIEHRFLMTESYFLIGTLKRAIREKKEFPYYSKIILRKKDNKFSFVKITEKEKEALIDIPDPTLEN